jgi:hypothetical protein
MSRIENVQILKSSKTTKNKKNSNLKIRILKKVKNEESKV